MAFNAVAKSFLEQGPGAVPSPSLALSAAPVSVYLKVPAA